MESEDRKRVLKKIVGVYEKIKENETTPYTIKIMGKELIALPNVFSPKYFGDSEIFAREVPKIVKNKTLLEIGTGTGVVAVFCALNGAKVVATDINPDAVKNCKLNVEKFNLDIDTRKGNLFDPIEDNEKFDFIFWNHPFIYAEKRAESVLLRAGLDYKYEGLREYIKQGKNFLKSDGKLLLGTGSIARTDIIEKIAKSNNYGIRLLKKIPFLDVETRYESTDIMIYELKPK